MELSAALRWLGGLVWAALLSCYGPPFAVVFLALMALMAFDTLLAILANGRKRNLDPDAGALGSRRKLGTLIFLLAFAVFYETLEYSGGWDLARFPGPAFAVSLFCGWELLSIAVNAKLCGVSLPGPLGQALDWLLQYMAPHKLPPVPPPEPTP